MGHHAFTFSVFFTPLPVATKCMEKGHENAKPDGSNLGSTSSGAGVDYLHIMQRLHPWRAMLCYLTPPSRKDHFSGGFHGVARMYVLY